MSDTNAGLCALKAYVQEPRDQWVQNWPGQVVLCVSQIYWTAHVHAALDGSGPKLSVFWDSLQVIIIIMYSFKNRLSRRNPCIQCSKEILYTPHTHTHINMAKVK